MSLPTMSGTGRLTSDGELRFSASGTAVYKVNMAFNSRKKDNNGQWVDDSVYFVQGVLFKEAAEHAADSFSKGDEVVVTGRLKTEQWEDKQTGQKRSSTSLLVDAIGHTTRWAPSKSLKADRSKGSQSDDGPWGSAPAPAAAGSFADEPPF